MTNRCSDAIYFVLLLSVSLIGYALANRPSDDGAVLSLPKFDPPELVLEVPFAFPYSVVKFEKRPAPKLALSGNMESVLVEVRSALLESSGAVEIRPTEQLAGLID